MTPEKVGKVEARAHCLQNTGASEVLPHARWRVGTPGYSKFFLFPQGTQRHLALLVHGSTSAKLALTGWFPRHARRMATLGAVVWRSW